ncbi:hypothetical protein [Neisseria meningitidis]|uniref:hypothetical protein n=1 Tax=Neisseria meningitidis TaxID=487 RepID=UPI000AD22F19|nr:hypothetical protein [Neisseria meningitidis]
MFDLNLIHYKNHLSAVIPTDVKACLFESRIILHRHSRAGGNPNSLGSGNVQKSSEKSEVLDSRFHGNDESSDGIRPPRHSRAGGNLNVESKETFYPIFNAKAIYRE